MNTALDESITVLEILAVVSARRVPLAPELAGYLTLAIAEQYATDDDDVDPSQVYVSEEGSVAVVRLRKVKDAENGTETAIRGVLGKLLEASGSVTPSLAACARKRSSAGVVSLTAELEAALIPVNRSAGRRALARLAREVKRVVRGVGRNASLPTSERGGRAPASAPPPALTEAIPEATAAEVSTETASITDEKVPALADVASSHDSASEIRESSPAATSQTTARANASVDALIRDFKVSDAHGDAAISRDLRALVGLDVTPPPPDAEHRSGAPAQTEKTREADDELRFREVTDPADREPSLLPDDERLATTAPSKLKRHAAGSGAGGAGRSRGAGTGLAAALVLAALVAAATYAIKPDWFGSKRQPNSASDPLVAAAPETHPSALAQCRTSLVLADAPEGSEILLRVGQSPADIDRMPVGVRLEFVATADGYEPKRAVLPAGQAWEKAANGRPRFELGVQLERTKAKAEQFDAWPAGEPGSVVGGVGSGAVGVVHVVSSPQGAEVWLLAGLGPRAALDDIVPCDVDVDILVAGPGTLRRRIHLTAAQFIVDPAKPPVWRTARVSASVSRVP